MPAPTPWKHALTGGVGIVAGVALLSVDWSIAQLAAFVGLALVARGALHLVTTVRFVGFAGAFAVLDVAGDIGVGLTVVSWPGPTKLTVALLVGSWAIVRAIVGATIALTTRAENSWWVPSIVFAAIVGVLGAVLLAGSGGPLHGTVVTVGLLALVEGTRDVTEAAWLARQARGARRVAGARSAAAV